MKTWLYPLMALAACAPSLALGLTVVHLSTKTDHPAAKVRVDGSGYAANEDVDVYWDTTDVLLAVTNSTGSFSWHNFQVPVNATPGQHWVTATGRTSGDTAQVAFTVSTKWAEHGFTPSGRRNNPWENVISAANVNTLDVAWTVQTNGIVASSAAYRKGVVYIGSLDGNLYAVKATSGATLWTAATGDSIRSSPAVANGVVYVGSFDDKLYAFNASTGATLWTATTGNSIYSSPAVANGVVYVGSEDENLYAFNASTGATLWTATTGNSIYSSPAVANGVVYVGSEDENLYAFNASTGATLWTATTGKQYCFISCGG